MGAEEVGPVRTRHCKPRAEGAEQQYGRGYAPFFVYLGDSSILVDGGTQSLLVVGPSGKVSRVMAAPFPEHMSRLTICCAWSDADGSLIYRIEERLPSLSASITAKDTAAIRRALDPGTTAHLVRANFNTRKLDTLAHISMGATSRTVVSVDRGRVTAKLFTEPHPRPDDFAVLSDGSLMIVRGHDYHVDIVRMSLERKQSPKLPFDWKHISDEEKQVIVDSLKVARANADQQIREITASMNRGQRAGGAGGTATGAQSSLGGGISRVSPSEPSSEVVREYGVLGAHEISDYLPPIRRNASKADMDGNLWILPTTSAQSRNGELVYDVVNRDGVLTHRVRMPEGRSIVGFGKKGVLFLASRDGELWRLERSRIKPL